MNDRDEWITQVAQQFLEFCTATGTATADVINVEAIPDEFDRRAIVGPAVALLRDAGLIRKTSAFVASRRPHAHSHPKRRWSLADPQASADWLAKHPTDGPREKQGRLF